MYLNVQEIHSIMTYVHIWLVLEVQSYVIPETLLLVLCVGMIMHLDYPGLSDYYFIDPHWLYNVFRRVCTSSMLTSSSINSKSHNT